VTAIKKVPFRFFHDGDVLNEKELEKPLILYPPAWEQQFEPASTAGIRIGREGESRHIRNILAWKPLNENRGPSYVFTQRVTFQSGMKKALIERSIKFKGGSTISFPRPSRKEHTFSL